HEVRESRICNTRNPEEDFRHPAWLERSESNPTPSARARPATGGSGSGIKAWAEKALRAGRARV
ncbi:MAG: hypothetical protein ACPHYF_08215, partial [Akkermansiaceae bacterium]